MLKHIKHLLAVLPVVLFFSGCSDSVTGTKNDGPWVGNWVQVNFLALDDNGVWDEDDLTGIGFVENVTESKWVTTDGYGSGCSITMTYSVGGSNRFSRQAVSASDDCPSFPLNLLKDSGRLEFSDNDTYMIQWFDVQPGDDIAAFKFVRR